jgi:mannosyltransferase OCH1-like enzyme
MRDTIPKKIHYCWLSGEKMTADAKMCLRTWKKHMPEYEYVLWDSKKFDIDSHAFVKEACSVKKWAFASDYIRLYALYTEGGIYLDTDIYVLKSFDDFLENGFFSAVEYDKENTGKDIELINEDGSLKDIVPAFAGCVNGLQLQAAMMGGVKGHPFLKSCLDWYDSKHFILEDGAYFEKIISPEIYAHIATQYGFRYKNELQKLKHNMTVYPYTVLAGNVEQSEEDSYAIHLARGSWRNRSFWARAILVLKKNRLLRALFAHKESSKKYNRIVR